MNSIAVSRPVHKDGPGIHTLEAENQRLRAEVAEMSARIWRATQEYEAQTARLRREQEAHREARAHCDSLARQMEAMRAARGKPRNQELTQEDLWEALEFLEVEKARLSMELDSARSAHRHQQWSSERASVPTLVVVPPPTPDVRHSSGSVFRHTLFAAVAVH